MSNRAWVTLATNDSYGLGALVLAHSLRRAGSVYPAAVLITPSVTDAMRDRLSAVFVEVVTVDVLDSGDAAHLALLQRPELGITFTKIHCWKLTQFEKCVFLDADTLVVQNCDELFEREELSAAPDVGWPDCFNSGVFVFKPSQETFEELIKFAKERGSFDGGDQGLLNSFFSDWAHGDINKHLPFLYNVTSVAFYSYLPALKQYGQDLKIVHFIGTDKPWLQQYNWQSNTVDAPEYIREFLQLWWSLFVSQVHTQLDTAMVEVEEAPTSLPPQDVFKYYTPTVDPESEFPWHHADSQNVDDEDEANNVDMSDFFDPWKYYRGNIPPIKEDSSNLTNLPTVENLDEIRKYVWEYSSNYRSQQNNNQSEQQWSQGPQSLHSVPNQWQSQHTHNDTEPTHSHFHSDFHQWHNVEQTHQQNYHQQESHSHQLQQHWHDEERTNQNWVQEHVNPSEHNIDITPSHVYQIHHSHDHYNQKQSQEGLTFVNNKNSCNTTNISHFDHSTYLHKNDYPDDTSHIDNQIEYKHTSENANCKEQNIVQTYQAHIESQKPELANSNTNGFCDHGETTDDEEYFEELKPRHPYDGYYLKHRPIIDSRGRKICIHELPPTPSPSPPPGSPSESPIFGETILNDIDNDQTGVAGNLARVTPGASGYQREAVDELTRRQGWESGNIDYMGADSFDNIWAKISQTLSQSRTSPPKQSPPKEFSPPKDQAKDKDSEMGPATCDTLVSNVDVEGTHIESPASCKKSIDEKKVPEPSTKEPGKTSDDDPKTENVPITAESLNKLVAAVVEEKPSASTISSTTDKLMAAGEETTATLSVSDLVSSEVPAKVEKSTIAAAATVALKSPEVPAGEIVTDVSSSKVVADINMSAAVKVHTNVTEPLTEAPGAKEPVTKPVESDHVSLNTADSVTKVETSTSEALPKAPGAKAPITETAAPPPKTLIAAESTKNVDTTMSEVLPENRAAKAPISVSAASTSESLITADSATKIEATIVALPEASHHTPDTIKEETRAKTESQQLESAAKVTPDKQSVSSEKSTDSPPLANTPAKEEVPSAPPAKTDERRKPLEKLLLSPPSTADPVPTPDSELEDAASLAQSIIASELRTPTVSSPSPATSPASPPLPPPKQEKRLSVEEPEVPTPPVSSTTPVSLAQIGVKPKEKSNTAVQIESSITEKPATADKIFPTPQTPTSTTQPLPTSATADKTCLTPQTPTSTTADKICPTPQTPTSTTADKTCPTPQTPTSTTADKTCPTPQTPTSTTADKTCPTPQTPTSTTADKTCPTPQTPTTTTADKTCPTPQTPTTIKAPSTPGTTPSECSKKTPQNISEQTSPACKSSTSAAPKSGMPADGSKKKLEKKGSKESPASSVDAPVPPPRKKEKKPKEK